uniref:AIG1-type G domain-containing protein n=1 Tax=Amphimedon queenslandica TaxID=400682 RepID=A0A1X7SG93_AMPQE
MADCSGQQVVTEVAAKWPGVKGLPERANKALTALLEKAFVKQNELRILTTGKAGEGKSTLVNGILGAEVAPVGSHSTICTRSVAGYTKHVQDVPVTVFDSPGLQDTTENEDLYLEEMKEKCQRLSLILYCTKMTNIRLKDEDKNAMKKLTESFGEEFWKFALLVLTFANTEDVTRKDDRDEDAGKPEPHFDDDEGWKELGERRFKGRVGVSAEIAYEIPVIPVGDNKISRNNREPLRLPDRDNWFVEFWKACCLR